MMITTTQQELFIKPSNSRRSSPNSSPSTSLLLSNIAKQAMSSESRRALYTGDAIQLPRDIVTLHSTAPSIVRPPTPPIECPSLEEEEDSDMTPPDRRVVRKQSLIEFLELSVAGSDMDDPYIPQGLYPHPPKTKKTASIAVNLTEPSPMSLDNRTNLISTPKCDCSACAEFLAKQQCLADTSPCSSPLSNHQDFHSQPFSFAVVSTTPPY